MKNFLLITALLVSATSTFAMDRFLGSAYLQNRDFGDFVHVDSCRGPRDQRIDSLTLVVRGDGLDLRGINVRLEDRAGRRAGSVRLNVRPGIYRQGSRIRLDIPGARCIDSIQILGDSLGGGDDRMGRGRRNGRRGDDRWGRGNRGGRHSQPTVIDIYGDVRRGF